MVDPKASSDVSLAFAPSGQPAVAYTVPASNAPHEPIVKYAVFDGAHWTIETVGKGYSPSLAFDPDGQPAVAYERRIEPIAKLSID